MRTVWTTLAFATALIASTAPASAQDTPCPTTSDELNTVIEIHGARPDVNANYVIGMFNLLGHDVMGACVLDERGETLHAIVKRDDQSLLSNLPGANNHLCFTGRDEAILIVAQATGWCNGLKPLNYGGNVLTMYLGGGNDSARGGAGVDVIYGGPGNDYMQDYPANGAQFTTGVLYGESGNDVLKGGPGNGTYLDGGDGNDKVGDTGGSLDVLYARNGDDCCIDDSNDVYQRFQCGTGFDYVRSMAGKGTDCNATSSSCSVSESGFFAFCQ